MNRQTFFEYASGNVVTIKQPTTEQFRSAVYELLKTHGRMPTDTLETLKPDRKDCILTPIKPMSQTLRRQLITLGAEYGWDVIIKPNGSKPETW